MWEMKKNSRNYKKSITEETNQLDENCKCQTNDTTFWATETTAWCVNTSNVKHSFDISRILCERKQNDESGFLDSTNLGAFACWNLDQLKCHQIYHKIWTFQFK